MCIDRGVCEPECSEEANFPDTDAKLAPWLTLNAEYAVVWPIITVKRSVPGTAADFDCVSGKLSRYFSPFPGEGD